MLPLNVIVVLSFGETAGEADRRSGGADGVGRVRDWAIGQRRSGDRADGLRLADGDGRGVKLRRAGARRGSGAIDREINFAGRRWYR